MSDPNVTAPKRAKPKKRFRILLGVSLALNLLVIGAVVGAIAKGPFSGGGSSPGMRSAALPYVAAFERQDKRAMQREMRSRFPDRKAASAAHRAAYSAFMEVLRAETFDAARASEIMQEQFERAQSFQKVGRDVSIERLSQMSAAERAAYADRLQAHLDSAKKRGKRKER